MSARSWPLVCRACGTVLFADVKGSMDLSEQVDPEEWHKIMDRFFAILSEAEGGPAGASRGKLAAQVTTQTFQCAAAAPVAGTGAGETGVSPPTSAKRITSERGCTAQVGPCTGAARDHS